MRPLRIHNFWQYLFSAFVSPLFFVGLLLLALIGAAVCFLLQEADLKKAFVLGISAPALITSTLTSANSSGNGIAHFLPGFITSAYAQKPADPDSATGTPVFGRTVNLNLQSPVPVNVKFLDEHGNNVLTAVLSRSGEIPVPGLAREIQFVVRSTISRVYPLPSSVGESKTFAVDVRGDRNFGFSQAWGAPPDITFQISVKWAAISMVAPALQPQNPITAHSFIPEKASRGSDSRWTKNNV
jgi:hypothetical protein